MPKIRYERILLKLSGQILAGEREHGISQSRLAALGSEIAERRPGVSRHVVGGDNIFQGLSRNTAHGQGHAAMGNTRHHINALAIQDHLEKRGLQTRVLSAITMAQLAEPYIRRRAVRHLEKGRVTIMAGGTGNPYFTTDTAAVLRAIEIGAQVLLKATRVKGVYTADPAKDPNAVFLERVDYMDVLNRGLRVMDSTAITLCMENRLPIIVFDVNTPGNFKKVVFGETVGTLVGEC
jgi:uridylate kinase